MFDFLVFLERAKAFFLRKISILCGFSFFQIEILILGLGGLLITVLLNRQLLRGILGFFRVLNEIHSLIILLNNLGKLS